MGIMWEPLFEAHLWQNAKNYRIILIRKKLFCILQNCMDMEKEGENQGNFGMNSRTTSPTIC